MIYHLVPASELRARSDDSAYRPAGLAEQGFVHCAPRAAVLPVADDYYAELGEELLLLEIDPEQLGAETRQEAPATPPGKATGHQAAAARFPHVYGPIDLAAIRRVGVMERSDGGYAWPSHFSGPESFLPAPPRASNFAPLAARDLAIAGAALAGWWLAADWSAGGGPLADLAGVVVGLLVGICTFLLHEWGHLLGALATRCAIRPAPGPRSLYLFSFDSRRNSRGQFLVMSFAGFAGTALAVWAWYTWLPPELLATRVARGVGMLSVTLTLVLEVPLVGWSLLGRGLPPVETFGSERRRGLRASQG